MKQMYPFWVIIAIFFVLWFVRRTISKKYKPVMNRPKLFKAFSIGYIVWMALTPFIMILITEMVYDPNPYPLRAEGFLASLLVCALFELFAVSVLFIGAMGHVLCFILPMVIGITNAYLMRLRNIPFMLMDLLDVSTMGEVTGGYDMSPATVEVVAFIIGMSSILITFCLHSCFKVWIKERYSYKKSLIVGAASGVALMLLLSFVNFSKAFGIEMNMWRPGNTYMTNTTFSSFISYAQFSMIGKPAGYSKDEVSDILKEAEEEFDKKYGNIKRSKKTNVIDVMNESFTDYSIYGLKCPKDHLDYFYSLKDDENTIWHGYTYVSTYGGGTARSEFEYLTGYSMKFLTGAQPYSQFNFSDIPTLVKNFNAQGYETLATHPEARSNYRRHTVYPQMGFDKYYSMEDYEGYLPLDLVPSRISDWGNYDRIIDEFEEVSDPQFIHNVTMANHGGYQFEIPNPDARAKVDPQYNDVNEFIVYESLLSRSDDSLVRLFEYFREVDEPVIICMYGDHQPNLPEEFVDDLMEESYRSALGEVGNEEKRYKVPFVIWANYKAREVIKSYEFNNETVVSQNYLGPVTRAFAGMELTPFEKYLLLLREEIPVINESGYIADKKWHSHEEENKYTELINEYGRIQYAAMFDNKGLESLFYLEEE